MPAEEENLNTRKEESKNYRKVVFRIYRIKG